MSEMLIFVDDLVVIGKIVLVYGICGEVKVYFFIDLLDNLLDYCCWMFWCDGEIWQVELVRGCLYGKVLVVKFKGFDDCEEVCIFIGYEICILCSELFFFEEGEYYWYQLEGLKVIDQGGQLFGVIDYLLEIGVNDVMVVKFCVGSLDDCECLLFYIGQCVLLIDLVVGEMWVDWDVDF